MLVVGLTGNIGSGKSTVAGMLRGLGAQVIDTDQVARDVVKPGTPALKSIVAKFGEGVLNEDGSLNRARLAQIVFSDPMARNHLNAIVHPAIEHVIRQEIASYKKNIASALDGNTQIAQTAPFLIIEAPLLIETGFYKLVDEVWLVTVDLAGQLARTTLRDGATTEQIRQRIDAQLPQSEKIHYASQIIDNSGSLKQTQQQVLELYQQKTQTI